MAVPTFDELITEGESVPVDGWDFSWFEGRATEQRPSWGYSRLLAQRLATASAVLDIQTGGGEVIAGALKQLSSPPEVLAATESWPPNVEIARRNLGRRGGRVFEVADDADLPFPADSFDLVVSRHPTVVGWSEIARVLQSAGTYLSQQVGPGSVRELTDFMMGPQPVGDVRSPRRAVAAAEAAGLAVVDVRQEALRTEFYDVAAVVHFLRKVIWIVPGFTVDRYRDRLAELHRRIQVEGPFVAYAQRLLIEARKPRRDRILPRIRPATPSDLDDLVVVEVEAGRLFHMVGMSEVASHVPDRESLRRAQEHGLIWVAEVEGAIAGYIVAAVLDGNAHIEQVSVAPAYARRRIGRQLISHVEEWGRRDRRPATTLTTFRYVAWNGPYYQTLGYGELPESEIGGELAATMNHEASLPGMDASRRCAMIKRNDGGESLT